MKERVQGYSSVFLELGKCRRNVDGGFWIGG